MIEYKTLILLLALIWLVGGIFKIIVGARGIKKPDIYGPVDVVDGIIAVLLAFIVIIL